MNPDVSVILNVHREAVYVRRTIRSLSEAAVFAAAYSIRSELVVVFDRSDELTKEVACSSVPHDAFISVRYVEVDHGSLGLSRNSGIAAASGKYVLTADADDLISYNCISEMYAMAELFPRSAIFFEYVIPFGNACWVTKYFDDSITSTADFIYGQPYTSRVFVSRLDAVEIGFQDLRVTSGFAYEDWLFNCEMRARGIRIRIASKTMLFYRQRKGSLLQQADAVSIRQIPHNPLFVPLGFLARVIQDNDTKSLSDITAIRDKARNANPVAEIISDNSCCALLAAAIAIDPGINIELIRSANSHAMVFPNRHWGHDYADACYIVGDGPFTDFVLLPSLGRGGGEKYILGILLSLEQQLPDFRCLVITGEPAEAHPWVERLPGNSLFLDVFNAFPSISEHERDLLVLRLILAVSHPTSRLHLKSSFFALRWFGKFSGAIGSLLQTIFYFFPPSLVQFGDGSVEVGGDFDFLSTEIENLVWVISDHQRLIHHDLDRFGVYPDKWHCLYAPCLVGQPLDKEGPVFRILWASRICAQKRPELLPRIVQAACHIMPRLKFFAAGESEADGWVQAFIATEGLEYLGPFDNFDSLKPETFDAFLYTSAYDGLPNVVLEAMGHALPVIAPDVGGVREAVSSGKTGWLIPSVGGGDDALVAAYVDAIVELYENWERSQAMGRAGRDLIRQRHSLEHHRQVVGNIFLRLEQKNG